MENLGKAGRSEAGLQRVGRHPGHALHSIVPSRDFPGAALPRGMLTVCRYVYVP